MSKALRKTKAMTNLKFKMLLRNTAAIIGPLMAIGMTMFMNVLYANMSAGNPEMAASLQIMALNLGMSINIGMGAVMMTALPLAEEKHTLRSLMTSSVNDKHFLIGSIIPPLLITVLTNYLLVFLSGVAIAEIDFLLFSFLTIVASFTSCLVGLLIGIIAKSQVNANNIMMPFVMVLAFVPMFASLSESMEKVASFVYTGMISQMMNAFAAKQSYNLEIFQILILFLGILVFLVLFTYFYKKNVVDTE